MLGITFLCFDKLPSLYFLTWLFTMGSNYLWIYISITRNQALRIWFYNSRYGDWMEAESHNWSHFLFNPMGWTKCCVKVWFFWPLTASTTLEVKNDHAHVIMQDICNQFIEINFCVGCMVLQPNRLFQRSTTMSLKNRISITFLFYISKY